MPAGAMFSPNTDPALAQKFINGQFSTGAPADAGVTTYVETFVYATSFVFSAEEARVPSQSAALTKSLAGFFSEIAPQFKNQNPKARDDPPDVYLDHSAQLTKITLRESNSSFWAPVELKLQRKETLGDKPKYSVFGKNVYCPELKDFSSAVVFKKMPAPKVLYSLAAPQESLAHTAKRRDGLKCMITETYRSATELQRTCWVVPKRSPLALHFERLVPKTGDRRKWIEERVAKEDDAAMYMLERSAERTRESMIEWESAGMYLVDIAAGVHEFALVARPLVRPVGSDKIGADKIAAKNPLIEANLLVPPNRDDEIMERWLAKHSINVQIEFEFTVFT